MSGALVAAVGTANEPEALRARLERLRLSPDQRIAVEVHAGIGIGVLSHPLEPPRGAFHPFAARSRRYLAVLNGRVDNLARVTGDESILASECALDYWLRGGPEALGALTGAWVVAIADLKRRALHLIRDPLGDRSVCYAALGDGWIAATEEPALWPEAGPLALDPRRLAEFFAIEYPSPGSTFFDGIAELEPAHAVALESGRSPQARRYWSFRYRPEVRRLGMDAAAEELVRLLGEAVATRCDPHRPTAIAVSGGMDSPPLAALAPRSASPRLYTYSTPDFPDCDETTYAEALAARLETPLQPVRCDRHWPLSDLFFDPPWLVHEPSADAYRAMRFAVARAVAADGCRALVTGDFGDHLYSGYAYWLKDLLGTGQWSRGLKHFGSRLLREGLVGLRRDPPLRRVMPLVGITRGRRRHRGWLTGPANTLLGPSCRDHPVLGKVADVARIEGCINNFSARAAHLGYLQGLRWGVDIRTPFRDLSLVEFVLSLPAHYLYDPDRNVTKALMRRAFRDRLPAAIIERRGKTSLEPLFRHGLFGVRRQRLDELLAKDPIWPRFVDADWLRARMANGDWDDLSLTVLWNCLSFANWHRLLGREVVVDSGAASG